MDKKRTISASAASLSLVAGSVKVYIGSFFYAPLTDRPPRIHTHPCYELVCVELEDGGMRFTVNPPLVEHIASDAPSGNISSLLFELSQNGESDICQALGVSTPTDVADVYDGAARIRSLKSLISDTGRGAVEQMEAELRLLFVGLARSLSCGIDEAKPKGELHTANRFTRLEEYFNIHLADPNSSKSELAAELGVSERQLTRILLEVYNSNFSAILTRSRMTLAEAMLSKGDKTLEEIAASVGYYTREAFVKAYKKYYGKLPKRDIGKENKSRKFS